MLVTENLRPPLIKASIRVDVLKGPMLELRMRDFFVELLSTANARLQGRLPKQSGQA